MIFIYIIDILYSNFNSLLHRENIEYILHLILIPNAQLFSSVFKRQGMSFAIGLTVITIELPFKFTFISIFAFSFSELKT